MHLHFSPKENLLQVRGPWHHFRRSPHGQGRHSAIRIDGTAPVQWRKGWARKGWVPPHKNADVKVQTILNPRPHVFFLLRDFCNELRDINLFANGNPPQKTWVFDDPIPFFSCYPILEQQKCWLKQVFQNGFC